MNALVLLSGGMDSTVALAWARREYGRVGAIAFDYGQRHAVELQQAQKIASVLDAPLEVARLPLKEMTGARSSLLGDDVASPVVDGRNLLMLTVAACRARANHAGRLVAGYCFDDHVQFPDCRESFVSVAESALRLSFGCDLQVRTPLIRLPKNRIFALAAELGCLDLVLNESHTCYVGDRETVNEWGMGCGECGSCRLRAKGWAVFQSETTP